MADLGLDLGKRPESRCGQGQMPGGDTGMQDPGFVAQRGSEAGFRGPPGDLLPPHPAPSGGTSSINSSGGARHHRATK